MLKLDKKLWSLRKQRLLAPRWQQGMIDREIAQTKQLKNKFNGNIVRKRNRGFKYLIVGTLLSLL